MVSLIKDWVLAKVFIYGFGQLERQDLVTKALERCYTVPQLKRVWGAFTDSVISLLEDAVGEAKKAKSWSGKIN
jgi:hypothetical protein